MGRRFVENKPSTKIGVRLTSIVNTLTDTRRRRSSFNVGRVLVPNNRAEEAEVKMQCLFSACSRQPPCHMTLTLAMGP